MRRLEIFGLKEKKIVTLHEGEYYLGRSDSVEIPLDAKGISRNHARLYVTSDSVTITDLGSLNGTFVNEEEVSSRRLQEGDFIRIGGVSILYSEKEEKEERRSKVDRAPSLPEAEESVSTPITDYEKLNDKKEKKGLFAYIIQNLGGVTEAQVRFKIFALLLALVLGTILFIFVIVLPEYKNLARTELLNTGRMLTHFLAASNRYPLMKGQTILLDTSSVSAEKGVEAAYILDVKGKILEPTAMKITNDPYSKRAAKSNKFLIQNIDANHVIFSVPIRSDTERIGTARVDFVLNSFTKLNSKTNIMIFLGLIFLFTASILFSGIIISIILKPVQSIKEEIDICIKENLTTRITLVSNPQLKKLSEAINRLIIRGRSFAIKGGERDRKDAGAFSKTSSTSEGELLRSIPFGVISMNEEFKLQYVNNYFLKLFSIVRKKDFSGKHLLEVLSPGTRLNAIMNAIKELSKGDGSQLTWSDTYDNISTGVLLNFTLVVNRNSQGKALRWILIIQKKDE